MPMSDVLDGPLEVEAGPGPLHVASAHSLVTVLEDSAQPKQTEAAKPSQLIESPSAEDQLLTRAADQHPEQSRNSSKQPEDLQEQLSAVKQPAMEHSAVSPKKPAIAAGCTVNVPAPMERAAEHITGSSQGEQQKAEATPTEAAGEKDTEPCRSSVRKRPQKRKAEALEQATPGPCVGHKRPERLHRHDTTPVEAQQQQQQQQPGQAATAAPLPPGWVRQVCRLSFRQHAYIQSTMTLASTTSCIRLAFVHASRY